MGFLGFGLPVKTRRSVFKICWAMSRIFRTFAFAGGSFQTERTDNGRAGPPPDPREAYEDGTPAEAVRGLCAVFRRGSRRRASAHGSMRLQTAVILRQGHGMTAPLTWLIDTNVVSEMMRPRPEPQVVAFLDSISDDGLGLAPSPSGRCSTASPALPLRRCVPACRNPARRHSASGFPPPAFPGRRPSGRFSRFPTPWTVRCGGRFS